VPVTPGTLITRPRLHTLLDESLNYPLTLVSAPAGFGKTTFLSTWAHSLQAPHTRLCWISLDEEDNDPCLFWTYVLTALDEQGFHCCESLLIHLQSQPLPPLKSLLTALINLLAASQDHFVLILDDYQLITQEQVHTTLAYLVEHLPAQLRIVLSTRADPPLPLPLLRAHKRALEVRTDQLRCTVEETGTFLEQMMGSALPDETIQQVTVRTEGWLVGLRLLALSLQGNPNPTTLLEEASGDQHYILDYLTEEVLRRQSQQMQTFLLCTSILERLTAPLCDAVMGQTGSLQMLRQLEQANLFVVSLDQRHEWYRYHALFAEALHYHLEQRQADLVPILHHRASLWYAQHNQPTQAILHAFQTKEWSWAAELIEGQHAALKILTWGINKHKVLLLQDWFLQIPIDLLHVRPRLCLACTWLLLFVTPRTVLETRLTAIETLLRAELMTQTHQQDASAMHPAPAREELENLLGETITYRALIQSYDEGGESALALSLQAQALLSTDNVGIRGRLAMSKLFASYASCANDARTAVQIGLQCASLCQAVDHHDLAICAYEMTASHLIGTGCLHQAQQLTQHVLLLGSKQGAFVLPAGGQPMIWQAEVLHEWNQIEAARSLVEEAIQFWEQTESPHSLMFLDIGYGILLRVCLSCGDYHAACSALQEIERIGSSMNHIHLHLRSLFTTVDEVRLWLACGELDRATRWVEELDLKERHGTLFAREREEVACARILLAKQQPVLALQRLEPVLQRATTGQRWGHVIEIRLLQALALHILSQETQALHALSEAVRLAEPEGYIRSFVDEGILMETLLSHLRRRDRKCGPTPYLDTLLAAFQQDPRKHAQTEERTQAPVLPKPLSERELQVLQLLAQRISNQEIAQELVIAPDTVKWHVSHIFSKLGVHNRIQATKQARELGLLDEEVRIPLD
jgi:LuxR family maltose regulon positive regulatory protein